MSPLNNKEKWKWSLLWEFKPISWLKNCVFITTVDNTQNNFKVITCFWLIYPLESPRELFYEIYFCETRSDDFRSELDFILRIIH